MTHAEQANRTKAQLAAALKQKLQTKVISKITVSEQGVQYQPQHLLLSFRERL